MIMVPYNTQGQEVRTLVQQHHPAGHYEVQWNGRDDTGQPVASGMYLYELKAGDFRQIRKMLLLK